MSQEQLFLQVSLHTYNYVRAFSNPDSHSKFYRKLSSLGLNHIQCPHETFEALFEYLESNNSIHQILPKPNPKLKLRESQNNLVRSKIADSLAKGLELTPGTIQRKKKETSVQIREFKLNDIKVTFLAFYSILDRSNKKLFTISKGFLGTILNQIQSYLCISLQVNARTQNLLPALFIYK